MSNWQDQIDNLCYNMECEEENHEWEMGGNIEQVEVELATGYCATCGDEEKSNCASNGHDIINDFQDDDAADFPDEPQEANEFMKAQIPFIEKALIIGDTHGNTTFLKLAIEKAKEQDCDAVIQVGDFGWFPKLPSPVGEKIIRDYDFPVFFIDGNHEDFDDLWQYVADEPDKPIIEVRKNLWYIQRGSNIKIGNINCLFIGGAHSIDKVHRVKGVSWFPQENLRDVDVAKALSHKRVDVVFSHDCPDSINIVHDVHPESIWNRHRLQSIADKYKMIKWWYFGHYHQPYEKYNYDSCRLYRCMPADVNDPRKGVVFNFDENNEEKVVTI